MPNNLEPCPFCGEPPKKDQYPDGHYYIECEGLKQSCPKPTTDGYSVEEMADRQWNTRANDTVKVENSRLREILNAVKGAGIKTTRKELQDYVQRMLAEVDKTRAGR